MSSDDKQRECKKRELFDRLSKASLKNDQSELKAIVDELTNLGIPVTFKYAKREKRRKDKA